MTATLGGAVAESDAPAELELLPEDEHALECAALERLRNASSESELAAAWAQTQAEYSQRGADVPASVRQCHDEIRTTAFGPAAGERDAWLEQYDSG